MCGIVDARISIQPGDIVWCTHSDLSLTLSCSEFMHSS